MIKLIVVSEDALGEPTGPSTVDVLSRLSPLGTAAVAEEVRRVLHRTWPLLPADIDDLCAALLVERRRWPDPWPVVGFDLHPYAASALRELRRIAPVELLVDLPATCGPQRVDALLDGCGPLVDRAHTTYERGSRKPDFRLWRDLAVEHDIHEWELVHVGPTWIGDVLGPVSAGCRAVHLARREGWSPPPHQWPRGRERIGTTVDLRDVPAVVGQWLG